MVRNFLLNSKFKIYDAVGKLGLRSIISLIKELLLKLKDFIKTGNRNCFLENNLYLLIME